MPRGTVYYPQDEMTTPLLAVSQGCAYNQCAFCAMYKGLDYRVCPLDDIKDELLNAPPLTERLFLTGADPLTLGFGRLKKNLEAIRAYLPYCACVASYASIRGLKAYSAEELSTLHHLGLRRLYIGFESGDDPALKAMNKPHTRADAVHQAKKLEAAQIPYRAIILLGIKGRGQGIKNAKETASIFNQLAPEKIITMNLRIFAASPLQKRVDEKDFLPARKDERMEELSCLVKNLFPKKPLIFDTTHPTNFIKIKGSLPHDKEELLKKIDQAYQAL